MLHARESYNRIQDPAGKIADDEPVFLLRAKDKLAPDTMRFWATRLREEGGDLAMVEMVLKHADLAEEWQKEYTCKLPDLKPNEGPNAIDLFLKFEGVDDFSRIIFKDVNSNRRYGSVITLYSDGDVFPIASVEEVKQYFRNHTEEIEYFGTKFNCEPMGEIDPRLRITIVD